MRQTDTWRGKTDNAKVPAYVRLRIFNRENGICHISGRKITAADKWELEHKVALCNGGTHSEDNLAPALVKPHQAKTALDLAQKAKNDRVRKKHIGIRKPSRFACSRDSKWKRKLSGEVVARSCE